MNNTKGKVVMERKTNHKDNQHLTDWLNAFRRQDLQGRCSYEQAQITPRRRPVSDSMDRSIVECLLR